MSAPASRVLLVVDGKVPGRTLVEILRTKESLASLVLCPIGGRSGWLRELLKELTPPHRAGIEVLPFNEWFHEQAFALKPEFLRWLHDFSCGRLRSGQSLREALRLPGLAFSLWDFSLPAKKDTWSSPFYANLVRLSVLSRILGEGRWDEVWVAIGQPALSQCVVQWARTRGSKVVDLAPSPGRSFAMFLCSALAGSLKWLLLELRKMRLVGQMMPPFRKRRLHFRNVKHLFVNYFPFPDAEAMGRSKFVDSYFAPLQDALERENASDLAWVALIVNREGYDFSSSVALAGRLAAEGYRFSLVKEWTEWTDLLWAAGATVWSAWRSLRLLGILRKTRFVSGLPIWPLMAEEWAASFAGSHLMMMLTHYRAFRRVLSEAQPRFLYYSCEFQPWEKALNFASCEAGSTTTIGIQHSSLPELLLSYHADPREFERRRLESVQPYPDWLACVGEIPAKSLLAEGWPSDALVILGPMRFPDYPKLLSEWLDWRSRRSKLVVALSTGLPRSLEILDWTYEALADLVDVEIVVKNHPSTDLREIRESLGRAAEARFVFSQERLPTLLRDAKVMVTLESSAVFDGLASGCPVVVLRTPSCVDNSPLSGKTDLGRYAYSPSDLRLHVLEILGVGDNPMDRCKVTDFLGRYCDFPGSRDQYLSRLKARIENVTPRTQERAASAELFS